MVDELRLRRAAVGGAVLFLHVLAILALIAAFKIPVREPLARVREIVLDIAPATERTKTPQARNPFAIPPPNFLVPEAPRAITLAPGTPKPEPAAPQGDLGALGRYLYNCSGAYYEQLSPREKAHCLQNQFNSQGQPVTLGAAKPSPFDAVIAKRNAPFVPAEGPCPLDHPQSNLGLPCFGPGSGAPNPLNQFGH